MRKFLTKTILLLSVFLISFNANSDEYFCLDKDGFVYPLFEEKHCENQLDDKRSLMIKISLNRPNEKPLPYGHVVLPRN